ADKPTITPGNDATADPSATKEVDVRGFLDEKPRPLVGAGSGPAPGRDAEAATAGASELVGANAPQGGDEPDATGREGQTTIDLFGAEQAATEAPALDDDSFFA